MGKSIEANAVMSSLSGGCQPEKVSEEYKEYRRAWTENPRDFIVRDFPMHLDIESTNGCNLRCTFCDKSPYRTGSPEGNIDLKLYKRIIDEGSEHRLWGLKLSYRGEPLMNTNIVQMVEYAKKKGIIDVYFNTNGMLLDETMSKRLIGAGLDRISVSVEGVDAELFEKARVGAKFDRIKANVERLKSIREQNGSSVPKIRMQTVALPYVDVSEYKQYWSGIADEVAAIDYRDSEERVKGVESEYACPQLWQRMTIAWDGSIFPCNNDDLEVMKLGNASDKSIYELWNCDAMNGYRALHMAGKAHKIVGCDGCPWRAVQLSKLEKDVRK